MANSKFLIGAITLGALLVLGQCGIVTVSPAFSGHVTDADSGLPAPGVAVVAKWDLHGMEFSRVGLLAIEETVTDIEGRFTIPGWGPRFNKQFLYAGLSAFAPELIVFKNGYVPQYVRNHQARTIGGFYRRTDALDDREISLKSFRGPIIEYVQLAQEIDSRISHLLVEPGCAWQQIPRLLTELHRAGISAQNRDAEIGGQSLMITRIPQKDCVDPVIYFQDYI